jgi:hypothetical protein
VERAYQLIDNGQYSEAILVFQTLVENEDTPTNRLGLASAYAARAGVRVQKYWDLLFPSLHALPPKTFASTEKMRLDWNQLMPLIPGELRPLLEPHAQEVFNANDQLETLRWRFQKIPKIQGASQREDLMKAREALRDLESKGAHLYRAMLTLIVIRFDLEQTVLPLQALEKTGTEGWPCPAPLRDWLHRVPGPLEMIFELLSDIKISHPGKVGEIETLEADLHKRHFETLTALRVMESSLCKNR